ncbi:hypothetical protein TYRP_011785 [Tyrophagus putrescentiae]|nr:hypothetical protein TYRP_011785 [Tyrophagus putrescentiae]
MAVSSHPAESVSGAQGRKRRVPRVSRSCSWRRQAISRQTLSKRASEMVAGRFRYSNEEVEMEVVVVVGGGGLFEDEDEEEEEEVVVEAAGAVDGLLPFKSGFFFSELLFPADLGRLELDHQLINMSSTTAVASGGEPGKPNLSPTNKQKSGKSNSSKQQPNWLRRQYVLVKGLVLERTSGRVHRLLEQQFNPLFTFALVALGQLLYLGWLLSRGSLADANILIRAGVHVHVVALLVGGAAARCALAWLVYPVAEGEAGPPPGVIFDYPHHSKTSLVVKKDGEDNAANANASAEKKVQ